VPVVDATLPLQDSGEPSDEQQLNDQTSGIQDQTGATQSGGVLAQAGSPLAQQLDANPEAFSSGGYSFGPVYQANADGTPIAGDGDALDSPTVSQNGNQPQGTFSSGGTTFGPDYVAASDGTPIPTQMAAPTGALLGAVTSGMANAGGVVANISTADAAAISSSAQAVSSVSAAIVASALPSAALVYNAAMLGARAAVISSIVGGSSRARWTLNVVNPNLMLLAAQYYGDATQWATIANANGLTDPQPLGQFQLTIPAAA
jgi:hypothetical protein